MTEPKCLCGKTVDFYSALLEQGFCSDACYDAAVSAIRRVIKLNEGLTAEDERQCITLPNRK